MKNAIASFAILLGVFFLQSCSSDTDPTDSAGDSAGTTSASAIGGSIQGSDGGGTVRSAVGLNATCSLKDVTCSSGAVTVAYNGCTSKNGKLTLTGGFTLTLGGGLPACPGSGFWKTFFTTTGATLWRVFTAGTSSTNANGTVVTSDNTSPVGWDSAVTLTKNPTYNAYGLLRTNSSESGVTATTFTSNQTLMNYGVEHVATGTSKKGKNVTVWDHTLSFQGNGLKVVHTFDSATSTDQKVVDSVDATSFVVVQHNLAKWTGKSLVSGLTFVHAGANFCGCYPTAGTINTQYTGSRTSFEQMKFTYATTNVCGSFTLQPCSDATCTTLTGTATTGVLNHCL